MKSIFLGNVSSRCPAGKFAHAFLVAGFLFCAGSALAQTPPGFKGPPTNTPVASWSFHNPTSWTNDQGRSPISFSNLNFSWLGNGESLVVDTNLPAWLNFNVLEPSTGATNLVLHAPGSVTFWFAPADWSSTNAGGIGPAQWSELFEVGEWTSNAAYGYWGLSVDPPGTNLWFLAQDGSGNNYGLSAPISWTTNYFHYVALTYSSTNVSLYLDGVLATNDPGGLTIWPGSTAVAGGIYFGSDTNGFMQAGGLFNSVKTYAYVLDTNTINRIFGWDFNFYIIDPFNMAMSAIISGPSNPSPGPTPAVITGPGILVNSGTAATCTTGATNFIWLTNITAIATAGGAVNVTFAIEGGADGVLYDVFANSTLSFGTNGLPWAWMGQGGHCTNFTVNISSSACFLILGTPQDIDGDGLTDTYELLVSKTDPNNASSNLDNILDGWEILLGLNPKISNFTSPSQRSNYGYTKADWLNGVSGIKSGTITTDSEGNVQSVSQ